MNRHYYTMDKTVVVPLEGDIDGKTAPLLQEHILPLCTSGSSLVLDMQKVSYMSSAGLRLLLSIYRQVTAQQGHIALVGMASDLQDTMKATGFLRYFTIYSSVDEAVTALQDQG